MAIRKKLLVSALILTISSSLLTGCNQNTKETSNNAATSTSTKLAYNDLFKENEVMDVKNELSEEDLIDMKKNARDDE